MYIKWLNSAPSVDEYNFVLNNLFEGDTFCYIPDDSHVSL